MSIHVKSLVMLLSAECEQTKSVILFRQQYIYLDNLKSFVLTKNNINLLAHVIINVGIH